VNPLQGGHHPALEGRDDVKTASSFRTWSRPSVLGKISARCATDNRAVEAPENPGRFSPVGPNRSRQDRTDAAHSIQIDVCACIQLEAHSADTGLLIEKRFSRGNGCCIATVWDGALTTSASSWGSTSAIWLELPGRDPNIVRALAKVASALFGTSEAAIRVSGRSSEVHRQRFRQTMQH
jgi:hypothetical protein